MKLFVRITAVALAILFLTGAATAWIDFFKLDHATSDPALRQAAGWSLTGLMFLALGLRDWRSRRKRRAEAGRSDPPNPVR
jgi:hypothetical protein